MDSRVLLNHNAYYEFSYTLQILLQLSFDPRERRTKTLGKSMLKPPRVDDTFGSPNAVQTYKFSEHSMGMNIRNKYLSLFMVIKLFKLVMRRNIYMATFSEFA